jgi:DNA helicase IV
VSASDDPGRRDDGVGEDPDAVLEAETTYLTYARRCLAAMRTSVQSLTAQAGNRVSEEYLKAALARRAAALEDDPDVPLFFGRIDRASTGEQLHIGRRHVRDEAGDVVVVDWRAEVSLAFYRASAGEPMDVALRRRFGHTAGTLTSLEDERLSAGEEVTAAASAILTAEIERPRVGPMRDIVATIAPDQDTLVRAPLEQTLCVQGAPGTGKTAVGLHRAAYLLYAHRDQLRRSRVLVVGPNRSFLSYIGALLPALGEIDVEQVTVDDVVTGLRVRATDEPDVARLKGDARLATVIERAVLGAIRRPSEPLVIPVGSRRWRIPTDELTELLDRERTSASPYGVTRSRLPRLVAESVRRRAEGTGASPDDRWVARVARSQPVKDFVDSHWPAVAAKPIVMRLLGDTDFLARCADGVLDADEQARIVWDTPPATPGSARWSRADTFLVDEAAAHVTRPPSYGHVVIDEAQDLSAMACRAVGRRCETGSATVLGDVAQATAPDAVADWSQTLEHLGKSDGVVVSLTRGYRVPQEVLDLANRLLPSLAAGIGAAESIRHSAGSLRLRHTDGTVASVVVDTVSARLEQEGSIGVIASADDLAAVAKALVHAGVEHGRVEAGMGSRVELVPVTLCKGLEFDHVVVVEPAVIVGSHARGLHWLYVALTRAVSSLDVVHARPLPDPLTAAA